MCQKLGSHWLTRKNFKQKQWVFLHRSLNFAELRLSLAKTPSTRSQILWKTKTFFSEYGYRSHVTGVFGQRKRRFTNTLSRVESFENGDSSYSSGRAKTEVFKYDDVMPRF